MKSGQPLAKYLHELGLISALPSVSALAASAEGPIKFLQRLGQLDEQEAIARVAQGLGIEWCKIDSPEVQSKLDVKRLAAKINTEICWNRKVLPLWEESGKIVTAFADPLDHETLKTLEFALTKPLKIVIAEEAKIQRLLAENFPPSQADFDQLSSTEVSDPIEFIGLQNKDQDLDLNDADAPPIIKLCNKIVADAVRARASDIHVEPLQFGLDVRFRVDGVMQSVFEVPKRLQSYIITRFKILSGMDISERRRPQDGRIRVKVAGEMIDLRTSTVPTAHGEKMVLRVLNAEATQLTFDKLCLPTQLESTLKRGLSQKGKMLLVTGPTGSGKTTALYTCLNYLKDGKSNISTVEDPIEYRLAGINQIQVNDQINVTFASALRSILRQDPDVIMIGEIRDSETAQIAVQAAQTGHLVLSTLHTNSAPAAVTRLLNLGVEPYMVASSIFGILAQRLVRKVCSSCKTSAPAGYIERYKDLLGESVIKTEKLVHGTGCKSCNFTGYRGRMGVFSYLQVTPSIVDLIFSHASQSAVSKEAKKNGFLDLREAALALAEQGDTTLEEIKHLLAGGSDSEEGLKQAPVQATQVASETKVGGGIPLQKVVLIEDDQDVRQVLSMLLRKEMFEVIEADNGLEGIKKVYENNPQLILCDLMMPVMDGREFLLKMRGNEATKSIPVVFLTAADNEENETSLLDLGARDFLSKTSSSKVMLSRIRRALSKHS